MLFDDVSRCHVCVVEIMPKSWQSFRNGELLYLAFAIAKNNARVVVVAALCVLPYLWSEDILLRSNDLICLPRCL